MLNLESTFLLAEDSRSYIVAPCSCVTGPSLQLCPSHVDEKSLSKKQNALFCKFLVLRIWRMGSSKLRLQ